MDCKWKPQGYSIGGIAIYSLSVFLLLSRYGFSLKDLFPHFLSVGIIWSCLAWLLIRDQQQPTLRPPLPGELYLLLLLISWVVFYVVIGTEWFNKLAPADWLNDPRMVSIWVMSKKLLVFVLIPFLLYKYSGFSATDFGIQKLRLSSVNLPSLIYLVLLIAAIIGFQLFFSKNGNYLRETGLSTQQIFWGIPLCLLYLLVDVGLVEEFFFRVIMQSRLTALTKSAAGGIVLSSLLFALIHLPGLLLRNAESEGTESGSILFWASYCISYMGLAGVFLGIIYHRTKNLFYIMILHALVDLVPNLHGFLKDWNI